MKFPSIKNLTQSVGLVLYRFPFEMLFALTGSVAAIGYVEVNDVNLHIATWCLRVLMMANLGLLLSLATSLYCERHQMAKPRLLLYKVIAALAGLSFVFLINPLQHEADHIRFFLMSLGLHLLVAIAAFIKPNYVLGFWRFNAILFFRFLTSMLYSIVLYLGIAAAMGAMNFLFNFKFDWHSFLILWICIAGLFNTMFFLAGVPGDLLHLEDEFTYPIGIKIFTQFVLIPLATIYVLILLSYEMKILVEWNLPKGLVSNLILGYAVFGILALLLVFPVRDEVENKWIKTYTRSFYFLMLPLIVLLFLAVFTRIDRYGITEYRYFLIVLAFWLLFITLYFLTSRKQNIKIIPISLCIITLLSVYGPQSAFSVAMFSQRGALISIFQKNHAFKDGTLTHVDSLKISNKDGNKAAAKLEYLVTHYDITCLQPYISKDLQAVGDSIAKQKSLANSGFYLKYEIMQQKQAWVKNYLGLNRFSGYDFDDDDSVPTKYYTFKTYETDAVDVKGFDMVIPCNNDHGPDTSSFKFQNLDLKSMIQNNSVYALSINGEIAKFDVAPLIKNLTADSVTLKNRADTVNQPRYRHTDNVYQFPQQMLTITANTQHFEAVFRIYNMDVISNHKKKNVISALNGWYLIKKR